MLKKSYSELVNEAVQMIKHDDDLMETILEWNDEGEEEEEEAIIQDFTSPSNDWLRCQIKAEAAKAAANSYISAMDLLDSLHWADERQAIKHINTEAGLCAYYEEYFNAAIESSIDCDLSAGCIIHGLDPDEYMNYAAFEDMFNRNMAAGAGLLEGYSNAFDYLGTLLATGAAELIQPEE